MQSASHTFNGLGRVLCLCLSLFAAPLEPLMFVGEVVSRMTAVGMHRERLPSVRA